MAFNNKSRKPHSSSSSLCTTLFFIVLFTIPALFLLRTPTTPICSTVASHPNEQWSGDLRTVEFSWNRLNFLENSSPKLKLKIAVFSRKWPGGTTPGGMERHAFTLHTELARRGHQIHVFTSPLDGNSSSVGSRDEILASPQLHFHEGEPGKWLYRKAWEQFEEANLQEEFDVVHSESVAIPHWLARNVPNLAVSWHGIALESFHSDIYQDLTRKPSEPISPFFNNSIEGLVPKILNEIRFFHHYKHQVAISDSCGEMLRDVYQIPSARVHVIVNGVDEHDFREDKKLGSDFRSKIGVPSNASLVLGVAGRLVKDKGHPLLFEAMLKLRTKYPNVYLVVAGTGPWQQRYKELGHQAVVLGSMNPSQLKAFYNSIDIFVNPTLRPQGLDLTLMEAMMSGKPVMASRFPSIKGTIVVDKEFGFMFAPNVDSLMEVLEKVVNEGPKRLSERGKACREYAASMFTARKMAFAYERLFQCIKNESYCSYP